MAGQVALMGHSFPCRVALRNGSAQQFASALNRLNNTGNNPHQSRLEIRGAACSPLPRIQKSVLPCVSLLGLLGWLWKRTGVKTRPNRAAAESTLPAPRFCLTWHERDASRERFAASWMRLVCIG